MPVLLRNELREILPAWALCLALPMAEILFWQSDQGRSYGLGSFFLGCTILAALAIHKKIRSPKTLSASGDAPVERPNGRSTMLALSLALFAAFVVFSALSLLVNDSQDCVVPMLALMAIVPAIGMTPYFVLATRKRFAAIVFTIFLVGLGKSVAATAAEYVDPNAPGRFAVNPDGSVYMPMPWSHPNLRVWLFWTYNGVLSLSFFLLAMRRFHAMHRGMPESEVARDDWRTTGPLTSS
jgi:hypothetical protein